MAKFYTLFFILVLLISILNGVFSDCTITQDGIFINNDFPRVCSLTEAGPYKIYPYNGNIIEHNINATTEIYQIDVHPFYSNSYLEKLNFDGKQYSNLNIFESSKAMNLKLSVYPSNSLTLCNLKTLELNGAKTSEIKILPNLFCDSFEINDLIILKSTANISNTESRKLSITDINSTSDLENISKINITYLVSNKIILDDTYLELKASILEIPTKKMFTLNKGNLTSSTKIINSGTLIFNAGTVSLQNIIIEEGGTVKINGGTITGNDTITVRSNGKLEINEGTVSLQNIIIEEGGTVDINEGTITANTITNNGTITQTAGKLTVYNKITNNNLMNVSNQGELTTIDFDNNKNLAITTNAKLSVFSLVNKSDGTIITDNGNITSTQTKNYGTIDIYNDSNASLPKIELYGGTISFDSSEIKTSLEFVNYSATAYPHGKAHITLKNISDATLTYNNLDLTNILESENQNIIEIVDSTNINIKDSNFIFYKKEVTLPYTEHILNGTGIKIKDSTVNVTKSIFKGLTQDFAISGNKRLEVKGSSFYTITKFKTAIINYSPTEILSLNYIFYNNYFSEEPYLICTYCDSSTVLFSNQTNPQLNPAPDSDNSLGINTCETSQAVDTIINTLAEPIIENCMINFAKYNPNFKGFIGNVYSFTDAFDSDGDNVSETTIQFSSYPIIRDFGAIASALTGITALELSFGSTDLKTILETDLGIGYIAYENSNYDCTGTVLNADYKYIVGEHKVCAEKGGVQKRYNVNILSPNLRINIKDPNETVFYLYLDKNTDLYNSSYGTNTNITIEFADATLSNVFYYEYNSTEQKTPASALINASYTFNNSGYFIFFFGKTGPTAEEFANPDLYSGYIYKLDINVAPSTGGTETSQNNITLKIETNNIYYMNDNANIKISVCNTSTTNNVSDGILNYNISNTATNVIESNISLTSVATQDACKSFNLTDSLNSYGVGEGYYTINTSFTGNSGNGTVSETKVESFTVLQEIKTVKTPDMSPIILATLLGIIVIGYYVRNKKQE